jgi:acetyl esterase/lipase
MRRSGLQTASKFLFRQWGAHSTLSDRHQLDEPSGPHRAEEGTLDASESRDAKPQGYADSTRSASLPTDGNKIMTRFASSVRTIDALKTRPGGGCQPCGAGAEWITAPGVADDRVLLYLHGGGYIIGSMRTHREVISRMRGRKVE